MRKLVPLLIAVLALPLVAQTPAAPAPVPQPPQLRLPRASQKALVAQTVGLTDIAITYSRPGVKGRTIWGALVPFGAVWRTGANEATTIAFTEDVTINGEKLAKGTYAFATLPTATEWTLIFNSVATQWGAYSYDATKDVLRVKAKPEKAEFREWMMFEIPEVTADTARVVFRWENVAVPFTVKTATTSHVLASAREAIAAAKPDDWSTAFRAASFAFDNGVTDEATQWLDASLKTKQTTANLYLKARMEAKAGNTAAAIKSAEAALQAATDKDKALADEVRKSIDGWK